MAGQPRLPDHSRSSADNPTEPVSPSRGYAIACVAVALAFALRLAVKPMIGFASPFLLFTPAVMISAFYGGLVPGVVSTALSAVLGNHFFLQSLGEPGVERWDRVALFILVGGLITWVNVASRNARGQLTESLWREQRARAEAESANQAKDEFLALVSHELQTPASVLLGWASILRTRGVTGVALDRAIDAIERNARLQAKLVGDVLDTSRIVSGTLRIDRRVVDLGSIVAAAVEQIRPAVDARQLKLETGPLDGECSVLGDPVRLQQVFVNLLSNAVKFTQEGGHIRVTMAIRGADVRVAVADSGVGLDPQFVPRLFQRFQQDPATISQSRSGLGLGLSIARHFVERHHGAIGVESAGRGHGATFTVTLPRERFARPSLEPGEPRVVPDALHAISVLIVEDDDDTRALMTKMLETYGARVTAVGTAAAARRAVSRVKPHVMLCDLRLPDEDGIALIESLRSDGDQRIATIPAASMTALARLHDGERALAAGYQVHLQKPVEPDQLAAVILTLASGDDPEPVVH